MIVSDHNNSCWGTKVPGHKLNVSGHSRVWAQSCLGHSRVGPVMYGHKRGGTLHHTVLAVPRSK